MPIRKRLDLKGKAVVFVTTTVTDWIPVFSKKMFAEATLRQLNETAERFQVSIIAYVLMPSHLHGVFGFRQIEYLSKFMQSFKSLSSRIIENMCSDSSKSKLTVNDKFRLWKPRFDDLIITSEQHFKIKIDYIHNNPVKSGIVNHPGDYGYSSASDWLNDERGLLPIDKDFSFLK